MSPEKLKTSSLISSFFSDNFDSEISVELQEFKTKTAAVINKNK